MIPTHCTMRDDDISVALQYGLDHFTKQQHHKNPEAVEIFNRAISKYKNRIQDLLECNNRLLIRAREAEDANKWQPIATAPRDGRKILVHADDRAYVKGDYERANKIITVAYWNEETKYWYGWPMNSHYTVTHWKPLEGITL